MIRALLVLGSMLLCHCVSNVPTCSTDDDCEGYVPASDGIRLGLGSVICDSQIGCVQSCNLTGGGCEAGYACRLRDANTSGGVCRLVKESPSVVGGACGTTDDCANGLACTGTICVQLCDVNNSNCPISRQCVPAAGGLPVGIGTCN